MAGMVKIPGGSVKGIYCWEKSKVLDDGTRELVGFITSNTETRYPDGDIYKGYYYQRCYAEGQTVYLLATDVDATYAQLDTQEPVPLTATANDIRIGSVAVTDTGVVEGAKVIPTYQTKIGTRVIQANAAIVLPESDKYDYTKIQATIAVYGTKISNSVQVDKVTVDNSLYTANSTDKLSDLIKDHENAQVDFGIINGNTKAVMRYSIIKEEY